VVGMVCGFHHFSVHMFDVTSAPQGAQHGFEGRYLLAWVLLARWTGVVETAGYAVALTGWR